MEASAAGVPIAQEVERALDRGFDAGAFRGRRVLLAVPDATRPLDADQAIAPVAARLADAGARGIDVLVALGLHRRMRPEEIAPLDGIVRRYGLTLSEHDAGEARSIVELERAVPMFDLGASEADLAPTMPATFHRAVAEAEAIVAVGIVEPHQYAGFSGGTKTVAIGCAGRRTIDRMHGLEYLRHPGLRIGRIEGNPFRAGLDKLTAKLAPITALQIVPASSGSCLGAFFGPAGEAFGAAARVAAEHMFADVDRALDFLVLEVPASKAKSFYQASRAATYVALIDAPAIRRGGTLVVEAECEEGIGEGEGERACLAAMNRGREALLRELHGAESGAGISGGAQRAFILALALERCAVALVSRRAIDGLDAMGIRRFSTRKEAMESLALRGDGAIAPDVFRRLPRLRSERMKA
jgi:nickel-dependent lactate racemase